MCRNNAITGHSMPIETQFNKHQSLYECNTQQVSAVKIPADLISDKKKYQSILKDSRSIETQKNLFPKTAKNNQSKSRKRNNLVLHNSRNPSVGDSRYSSSLITVKKPTIKSRLFKHKKAKKCGISEIHSNKSNSSMRKACTPHYMFRQTDSRLEKRGGGKNIAGDQAKKHFKKTINAHTSTNEQPGSKKRKNRSKKRVNSRKKSYNKLMR